MARVDIDGNHCRLVWENEGITVTDEVHKLSTRTGLIYAIGRKSEPTVKYPNGDDLNVYYFTAVDYRTGKVVWEKQLGNGFNYNGFENVFDRPTGIAYISQYGGLDFDQRREDEGGISVKLDGLPSWRFVVYLRGAAAPHGHGRQAPNTVRP